jgi:hypothetical protein
VVSTGLVCVVGPNVGAERSGLTLPGFAADASYERV